MSLTRGTPFAAVALVFLAIAWAGCSKDKSSNPTIPLELDSPRLQLSQSYEHRFGGAGTYPYHCRIHSGMQGTVTVSDAAPAGDTLVAVAIQNTQFSPSFVTIRTGGRVVWTNQDVVEHTVTSD